MRSTTLFIVMAILISTLCGSESKPTSDFNNLCICPKIYKPVCASNNKTYSNSCLMACERSLTKDLIIQREGRCDLDDGKIELELL